VGSKLPTKLLETSKAAFKCLSFHIEQTHGWGVHRSWKELLVAIKLCIIVNRLLSYPGCPDYRKIQLCFDVSIGYNRYLIDSWGIDWVLMSSGVFKRRRARHLPRAPPFWGPPLRYYVHKFSLFLVKDVLFTHVIFYKANHKQVFCFQRAPLQKL